MSAARNAQASKFTKPGAAKVEWRNRELRPGPAGTGSDYVCPAQPVEFGLHSSQALTAVEHENVLGGQKTQGGVAVRIVVDRDFAGIESVAWCESLQDDLRFGYSRTGVCEVCI